MKDQLRALVKLSRIDSQAREIDGQLQDIPARLAEQKGDVTRLAGLLARERDALEHARALKKSHEEEIARHVDSLGHCRLPRFPPPSTRDGGRTLRRRTARTAGGLRATGADRLCPGVVRARTGPGACCLSD